MAVFVFILALALVIAGGGGILASVNLVPTEVGLLYAVCGVIALSAGAVVAAIGALIVRVDANARRLMRLLSAEAPAPPPSVEVAPPPVVPMVAAEPPAPDPLAAVPAPETDEEDEAPVNEYRSGHLPTLQEVEEAIAHPEAQPRIVGRYSAGGAHYKIYADGAIEAETEEGQLSFGSIDDLRAYVSEKKP